MKVVVAGSTGLAGSAITSLLKERGEQVIEVNSSVIDLMDRETTIQFIGDSKPDAVINAAGLVGGIRANAAKPVEFLIHNVTIQNNIAEASHKAGVERLVFLGSSCIYPRLCPQPIKEEYLLTGPLEETNSAYAIAKISGIKLIQAYRRQHRKKWISLMPTNLYGPRDNFSLKDGHVIPALINKFDSAISNKSEVVELWGTGRAKREFLHSQDLAEATVFALENYDDEVHLNVGTGKDLSIWELASIISELSGFSGELRFDASKPDGTPRKVLDVSRIKSLGWESRVTLREGILETIHWFRSNKGTVRQ